MPAPVKAFSNPTTLNWLSPLDLPKNAVKTINSPGITAALMPSAPDYTLVVVAGMLDKSLPLNQVKTIPLPPMGRQMLLTFPPVYKERGGSGNARPTTGQLWPRIQRN
jgi:hypothetical protein